MVSSPYPVSISPVLWMPFPPVGTSVNKYGDVPIMLSLPVPVLIVPELYIPSELPNLGSAPAADPLVPFMISSPSPVVIMPLENNPLPLGRPLVEDPPFPTIESFSVPVSSVPPAIKIPSPLLPKLSAVPPRPLIVSLPCPVVINPPNPLNDELRNMPYPPPLPVPDNSSLSPAVIN